ncbi:Kelch motif-containing protein [Tenacibaculum sp. MAR_2009_124]|uniref:Kelch repeat-containing protein n=1 Tax=Tenacibaculum sp. MAR_2009_124 TaxID=1250059 RepID=UPI0008954290|nr:carboxypeptidase-like regulatory domain-containing protein [Tenacibaculum sp. MAR_2009_124]SEB38181.1 Kelch motif-containing protein [Tenacibaculum sp. MAR_2009_124]
MLRKIKFLLVLLIITAVNCYGQKISGRVLDIETKMPLEKVNIYSTTNETIGVATNKNGKFTLKHTFTKTDSISISLVGYKKYTLPISILKNNSKPIFLVKQIDQLEEVSINTKKKRDRLKFEEIGNLNSGIFSFASKILDNKIFIAGGDETLREDNYSKAVDRASMSGNFSISPKSISRYQEPSLNYKSYNDNLYVYTIDNKTLKKFAIKLEKRAYHEMNFHNDFLYIFGGKKVSNFNGKEYLLNTIEVLDIKTQKAIIDQVNPHKAVNFSSFVYKDHLIVIGGSKKVKKSGKKIFEDKIHLLNFSTGIWHEIGTMPNPRETSAVLINDTVYLIGGFHNNPSNLIESWNLTNNKWKIEGKLFSDIEKPALTYDDESIYIFDNRKIIRYNIKEKILKEYAINLSLKSARIHYYNNALYILGGYRNKKYSKEPSSEIYKVNISDFDNTATYRSKKII